MHLQCTREFLRDLLQAPTKPSGNKRNDTSACLKGAGGRRKSYRELQELWSLKTHITKTHFDESPSGFDGTTGFDIFWRLFYLED